MYYLFFEIVSLEYDQKQKLTRLRPTQWAVCLGEAPSVWLSRAHQSGRTTSPSFYSAGPCTGQRAG